MKATLIYDGECPVCRRAVEWVKRNARADAIEYLPCQAEERKERFPGMPEEQCMEAMQLALPSGEIYSGDRALPPLFERMDRWRWMARFFRLPIVSALAPYAYRFIARHRYAISAIVAHSGDRDSGDRCSTDNGCR